MGWLDCWVWVSGIHLSVPGYRIWEEVVFYSPGVTCPGGQLAWPQASGFSFALVGDFSFYPGGEKKVFGGCVATHADTHTTPTPHPPPNRVPGTQFWDGVDSCSERGLSPVLLLEILSNLLLCY